MLLDRGAIETLKPVNQGPSGVPDHMADKVRENLDNVRVTKVDVILSKEHVTPGIPFSGLWPRVTIALGSKVRTVPLRSMAKVKHQHMKPGELSRIEKELLRIAGGRTTSKLTPGRKRSLDAAAAGVNLKVVAALRGAASRKTGVGERLQKAQKKSRKDHILKVVEVKLQDVYRSMKVELRGSEISRVWDTLVKNNVVSEVMET